MFVFLFGDLGVGEKEIEDKELNSEAPSSLSEATTEKEANSVSQSNAVLSTKEEERSNSIKKVGYHFADCLAAQINHLNSAFT